MFINSTMKKLVAALSRFAGLVGAKSTAEAKNAEDDGHDRTERRSSARNDFMKQTGYPHVRPGYYVGLMVPLNLGGKDIPSNMRWHAKAKGKLV